MAGQDLQANFISFLKGQLDQNRKTTPQDEPSQDGPSPLTTLGPPRARCPSKEPIRRSRARPGNDPEFSRHPQHGTMWSPDAGGPPIPHRNLMRQPETRPITQDQLVSEVKSIYAGLVMVESKCIEVDDAQSSQNDTKVNNEQWQALKALHRTLLQESHDLFLASQPPTTNLPLRPLATKYAMPARVWCPEIHSFLELLRHRLPASLEHMAYSMMARLIETIPAFADAWIECLGDLGRYRMAIEDDDIRDRETWRAVSRRWHSTTYNNTPSMDRLFHRTQVVDRSDVPPRPPLQYFAMKGLLCIEDPFPPDRFRESPPEEADLTLLDPILSNMCNTDYDHVGDFLGLWARNVLLSPGFTAKLPSLLKNRLGKAVARAWIKPALLSHITRFVYRHRNVHGLLQIFAGLHVLPGATATPTPDTTGSRLEATPEADWPWYVSMAIFTLAWPLCAVLLGNHKLWFAVASLVFLCAYALQAFGDGGGLHPAMGAGLPCIFYTGVWLAQEAKSLRPPQRRLFVFAVGITFVILDISLARSSLGSPDTLECTRLFGSDRCTGVLGLVTALIIPCLTLSTAFWWCIRSISSTLDGAQRPDDVLSHGGGHV
ncbi:hypothetical protein F4780DRAFT_728108 [Xylariomycetidae sp. FL0641]|nr:hypothetical protein F4780DRAFT_728108 [Xylariomycetidae sp. FL0641]